MRRRHPSRHPGPNRRGHTLVMFALILPLLLGMVGLAIDSGLLLATYRQTQNAADAGALAAAVDLFNSKTTATAQATGTSYVQTYNNMSGATVTINIPPLWARIRAAEPPTPRPSSATLTRPRSSSCSASTRARPSQPAPWRDITLRRPTGSWSCCRSRPTAFPRASASSVARS